MINAADLEAWARLDESYGQRRAREHGDEDRRKRLAERVRRQTREVFFDGRRLAAAHRATGTERALVSTSTTPPKGSVKVGHFFPKRI